MNCILIIGIPITTEGKIPKFKALLTKKVLPKLGLHLNIINMELEAKDGKTTGFAVLEFNNYEIASIAAKKFNDYKLTKKITF